MSVNLSLDVNENENKNENKMFTLKSTDGKSINVDSDILRNSGLMQTIFDFEEECKEIILELPFNQLHKAIEYLIYIDKNPPTEIQKPIMDLTLKTVVSDWELNFVNELLNEYEFIFRMINTANYMDIQSLMDLCMAKVATFIKFKKDDELIEIIEKL